MGGESSISRWWRWRFRFLFRRHLGEHFLARRAEGVDITVETLAHDAFAVETFDTVLGGLDLFEYQSG